MSRALASTTLTDFPSVLGHFTNCWAFRSALRVTNSIVVTVPDLFTFWPVREFLAEFHTAKLVLWSVVFTHTVGCSRPPSAVNDPTATKIRKKSWKSHVWGFIQRRQTTGLSVPSCHFARKLICGLSLIYHELHQESLHCHQLEEELDDWCQYWYFQNCTSLSCRSPDSWCRRFNAVNASLKSERSFNGPDLPELLREIHQFFLHRKYSACVIW